jgi:hypothetical protein
VNEQSKSFSDKTIANMSNEEFDTLVEQFIERGEDRVTLPTFLYALAAPPPSCYPRPGNMEVNRCRHRN